MSMPLLVSFDGRSERVEGLAADIVRIVVEYKGELSKSTAGAIELRYSPSDIEIHRRDKMGGRRRER